MGTVEVNYINSQGKHDSFTVYTPTDEMLETIERKATEVWDETMLLVTLAPLAPDITIYTGLLAAFLTKEELRTIAGILVTGATSEAANLGADGVASDGFVAMASDGSPEGTAKMEELMQMWKQQLGRTDE